MARKTEKQKKRDYKRGGKKMSSEVAKGKKQEKIADVMEEFKEGTLRSGSKKGPKVKSKKQALAIALEEGRKAVKKPTKKKKYRKHMERYANGKTDKEKYMAYLDAFKKRKKKRK